MKIICHYSEIALKGKNRPYFEKTLIKNIKKALKKGFFKNIKRMSGLILINLTKKGEKNKKEIKKALKKVFGIAYFTFAKSVSQNIKDIKKESLKQLKNKKFNSFKNKN